MVNFTLRSTTMEIILISTSQALISISTSQTFRSWVVILHLRQPMEFLSLNNTIRPGLLLVWMFILRARRLSSKLRKQGYLAKRLKSSFRKFYGRYGDPIQQHEVSLSRMLNYILILGQMHPAELEIKDTTESTTSASYLDLLLSIGRDGQLHTSIYDNGDDFNFHITSFDFNFHITNFPFLSSNIPSSPAYGVFISQKYDTPGLAPRMNVYTEGQATFQ